MIKPQISINIFIDKTARYKMSVWSYQPVNSLPHGCFKLCRGPYFEGLTQDCRNSSVSSMELMQFSGKPPIYTVIIHNHLVHRWYGTPVPDH